MDPLVLHRGVVSGCKGNEYGRSQCQVRLDATHTAVLDHLKETLEISVGN